MTMPRNSKSSLHATPVQDPNSCSLRKASCLIFCLSFALLVVPVYGQVGPAEIADPQLKSAEQSYLPQMVELNRAIARLKFPFSFALSRYAGLDPKQQVGADARGLEFVHFHGNLVLKVTGNYNAAYSAELLSQNQRADRVFEHVVLPILQLLPDHFSLQDRFESFGFEIAYHVRTHSRAFEYEGKEILVVVLDKPDALSFTAGTDDAKRQEVLNRAEIYLNGKPFGLALGARDPFDAEALAQSVRSRQPSVVPAAARSSEAQDAAKQAAVLPDPVIQYPKPAVVPKNLPERPDSASASRPDLDTLQKKYRAQLDKLAIDGVAKHHFVDYSPPSFVVFRGQIALQLTLKNPYKFDGDGTSIYRRAARSFDLFLAPQLKPILDNIPDNDDFASLDITVVNELALKAGQSSEALEFVFPAKILRQFVDYAITNQDLINQSMVLVNGVRIALNLQLVE
jgi:hypothetical protein